MVFFSWSKIKLTYRQFIHNVTLLRLLTIEGQQCVLCRSTIEKNLGLRVLDIFVQF